MVNILPIASGKGGVGKSSIAVNLAITLARKQKKVILADFDLGGANLHTLLGIKNNHAGIGNFVYKQTHSLSSLLQPTQVQGLSFIAGDCLYPGTPNMDYFTKCKIVKELNTLDADYIILDLGAGTTYNTLDLFLLTKNSLIVTTPELTSILNAYSFLKAAVFRFFCRQFTSKSDERKTIDEFLKLSPNGSEASFSELVQYMTNLFPETAPQAMQILRDFRPQVIVNMGKTSNDLEMAKRLRSLAQKKLDTNIDFIGFLPKDDKISLSVAKRTPLSLWEPDCEFVKAIQTAAVRIMQHTYTCEHADMFTNNDDRDLTVLTEEFNNNAIAVPAAADKGLSL